MHDTDWLAQRFEEHRTRLTAIANRMLGSASEADDAVQEAWIRLSRSDADAIDNLGGWLTTVVSRVCLNVLQARRSRPEVPLEPDAPEPAATGPDPEQEALLADSIGLALLVVLDTLSPAERVAFVLHDLFGVPFEEIAPITGRTEPAARQLASRARRRVRRQEDRTPRPTGSARPSSSRPSSPPRAAASSSACSPSSTPTSCSAPTGPPCRWARRRRLRGAAEVARSPAVRAEPRRRCWTAHPRSSGSRAASCGSSTTSPSAATGSRPST